MRSEKTSGEYFSRPSKVCGKLAAEYLEATSTGHRGLFDQISTVGKQKPTLFDGRLMADYRPSSPEAVKGDLFRDLTNKENPTKVDCRPRESKDEACRHTKCQRNAKLLEKSMTIIEQLKNYVAKATVKSPVKDPKKSACVPSDLVSPNRPDIAQTLEFAWTSNGKQISPFTLPEPKFDECRSVATQTTAFESPPRPTALSKSTVDKTCQVGLDTDRQNKMIDDLRRSLETATTAKIELEHQRRLLEAKVPV